MSECDDFRSASGFSRARWCPVSIVVGSYCINCYIRYFVQADPQNIPCDDMPLSTYTLRLSIRELAQSFCFTVLLTTRMKRNNPEPMEKVERMQV